jgi:hypothetical protein
MKIAFFLPQICITGGIYVIFEYAVKLTLSYGCDVRIITPVGASQDVSWHSSANILTFINVDEANSTEFDIVFATFWSTVFNFEKIHAKCYAYFVQSIESRFYPEWDEINRQRAELTYVVGFPTITEATWISNYLLEKYGNLAYLVKNGIRKDLYTQIGHSISPMLPSGKLRVLVEGSLNSAYKNVRRTLELCRMSNADEVWLLTPDKNAPQILADRVFSAIPIDKVPEIYRSCDVLVKLSYVEGMFGPPLEMFHCGGTAIVYNVTGHDEYIINEYNGLVIEKDYEQGVIDAINKLKHNPKLLESYKLNALLTASTWHDWSDAAKEFHAATLKIVTSVTARENKRNLAIIKQVGEIGRISSINSRCLKILYKLKCYLNFK